MRQLFLLAFLATVSFQAIAQKKVEYYPNGVKKFEGDYFYAWKTSDAGEMVWPLDTTELYDPRQSKVKELDMYLNMFPTKEYEGVCTFYYQNGQEAFQGNYSRGVKNGKFSYWWVDGTLVAEKSFVHGMADGKWVTYGLFKQAMVTESYKAFTQAQLEMLFGDVVNEFTRDRNSEGGRLDKDWLNMQSRRKIDYEYGDAAVAGAERFVSQMDDFLELLQQRSIWDGEFIYLNSETKKKAIEMYFKDNVPVGTWKVWDGEGKVDMEGTFKGGKLVKYKDHRSPAESDGSSGKAPKQEAPQQRQTSKNKKEVVEDALKEPPPGIVEAPPPPEVFKYVEQMPEASYDVNEYITKNLKYPPDFALENHGARIIVNFTVLEDGTIANPKIVGSKRHIPSVEQAALDVVGSMPKWKPGKQNGKAVKVDFSIPVVFKAK